MWAIIKEPMNFPGAMYTSAIALALASSRGRSWLSFKVKANLSIHIIASLCNESITHFLASLSACKTNTLAYLSSSFFSWVAARSSFSLYSLMMAHIFPSVLLNCWDKLLFDLWQSFRAFLVSCSKASVVAILMSFSSSYSFQTLMAVDLNFSLTARACSSSAFRACTSSLSSCVQTLNHLW